MNLDRGRCIWIDVLVCVFYLSVNFIHYSCPCVNFIIIIKSGFSPEKYYFTSGLILFQKSIVFPSGQYLRQELHQESVAVPFLQSACR